MLQVVHRHVSRQVLDFKTEERVTDYEYSYSGVPPPMGSNICYRSSKPLSKS